MLDWDAVGVKMCLDFDLHGGYPHRHVLMLSNDVL